MKKLPYPHPVFNVDGTITHACDLLVPKGNKRECERFFVTNLGYDQLLFGYPWFKAFKPEIDWEKGKLLGPKVQMETLLFGTLQHAKNWVKSKVPVNEGLILEAQQTWCTPWLGVTPLGIKGGPVEINHTHMLRAKDPKVRHAWVCITAAGLVLQGIAGSKHWPLDVLV